MIHESACGRIVAYGMIRNAASVVAAMTDIVRRPSRWRACARIAMAIPGTSANTRAAPMYPSRSTSVKMMSSPSHSWSVHG